MSAPCAFAAREDVMQLQERFLSAAASGGNLQELQPDLQLRTDKMPRSLAARPCALRAPSVAVVSGPTVLLAASEVADAIIEAGEVARREGNEQLADRLEDMLGRALDRMLNTLDKHAEHLDGSDDLSRSALERLSRKK